MTVPGLAHKVAAIARSFTRAKIPYAFGGALALAYYTVPRATIDIDVNVFVGIEQYDRVASVLRRTGIDTMPEHELIERDGQGRARWGATPVDLFFSYGPIHEAMSEAARTVPFGDRTIAILAPEHLLVAKAVYDRPKDRIDIRQMLIAVEALDLDEIRRWLGELVGPSDPRFKRVEALIGKLRA